MKIQTIYYYFINFTNNQIEKFRKFQVNYKILNQIMKNFKKS